jgi:hypothetical protein
MSKIKIKIKVKRVDAKGAKERQGRQEEKEE